MMATENAERIARRQNLPDGEKMLDLIDSAILEVDEIDLSEPYPEDRIHEIADSTVPVYNSEVYEIVPELHGYEISDPGIMPEDADIAKMAQVLIFDVLHAAASARLVERQEEEPNDALIEDEARELARGDAQMWENLPERAKDSYRDFAREELAD